MASPMAERTLAVPWYCFAVVLAAALGHPVWLLVPFAPDWRWLLGRDDSPWYPTLRIFRQSETRGYGSVIERVRAELSGLVNAWKEAQNP